jgi:hypothetical protein
MERKNQICEAGQQYLDSMDEFQRYHTYPREAFIDGAKWSDEHPDSKHTYTKQQLIDMGFAFTINGDIVPPDQLNEDLKKYLKYQKRKFIEKAKGWLEKTLYIHTEMEEDNDWGITNPINWVTSDDYESVEDFINGFCKAMEE